MIADEDVRKILKQMSVFHQSGAISGQAFAWIAESLIASSGIDERDEELNALGEFLAAYSPSGGEGLYDDSALRARTGRIAQV